MSFSNWLKQQTKRTPITRQRPTIKKTLQIESLEARRVFAGVYGDFNSDGYDDVVAAAPYEDVGSIRDAGSVHVIYGSRSGVSTQDQVWHANVRGVAGAAERHAHFGTSTAVGDFDGDGYDDLAIGTPDDNFFKVIPHGGTRINEIVSHSDAGSVTILYGSNNGLQSSRSQLFTQDSNGILDAPEKGDRFGASLAAGDFNRDGKDDLAIGVPNEDVGRVTDAGAVNVIYGAKSGLHQTKNQLWTQNALRGSNAEKYDRFGAVLATGDFNGDRRDDLAVGAPHEDIGSVQNAGAVNVIYGRSSRGLSTSGNQLWHQNTSGIYDRAERDEYFGSALATGDFDRDGKDDLAIGVPREAIGGHLGAGAVHVIYGRYSYSGLSSRDDDFWHQDRRGVKSTAEDNDHFGGSLATGDFDADGYEDLAVGVPGEGINYRRAAGAVNILFGSGSDLVADPHPNAIHQPLSFLHQNVRGVGSSAEQSDAFGDTLAVGDFDGDGRDDLIVGVPGESISNKVSGAVNVFYGSKLLDGLGGGQLLHQGSKGIKGITEAGDQFGTLGTQWWR